MEYKPSSEANKCQQPLTLTVFSEHYGGRISPWSGALLLWSIERMGHGVGGWVGGWGWGMSIRLILCRDEGAGWG